MTKYEKDYKEALEGNEIEVLTRRKKELEQLKKELKKTRNNFRAQCLMQEIERKTEEYYKIDNLF